MRIKYLLSNSVQNHNDSVIATFSSRVKKGENKKNIF